MRSSKRRQLLRHQGTARRPGLPPSDSKKWVKQNRATDTAFMEISYAISLEHHFPTEFPGVNKY